jgi:GAF domain-containing protein
MRLIRSGESRYAAHSREDDILSGLPRPAGAAEAFSEREDIVSSAGVLLEVMGEIVGVLFVNYRRPHSFDEKERDKIVLFARQAAVVIQTARRKDQLFNTIQQLDTELDGLHRVVQERDVDKVLDQTLESVNSILGKGVSSSINLYEEKADRFYSFRAAGPLRDFLLRELPRQAGTGRHVLKTGKPLYLDDVRIPPPDCPTVREEAIARGVGSFAALPLTWKEQVVGVLFVNIQGSLVFSAEIKRVLELFADQVAIAIENTRLIEELEERAAKLERLQNIAASVSARAANLDELLSLVVDGLSNDVFPGASCAIRLYASKADEFAPRIATSRLKDLMELVPRLDGTSRYVVRKKAPLYIEDTSALPPAGVPHIRQEFLDRDVKAIAYLPLIGEGNAVTGILYVNLFTPYQFSPNDRLILELFAHQAAVTIERERQFDQLRAMNAQLQALNQLGDNLAALE